MERLTEVLHARLEKPCSSNELVGYLTVLLYQAGYKVKPPVKPVGCCNFGRAGQFIYEQFPGPLGVMGRMIANKLEDSKPWHTLKRVAIGDHAMGLLEEAGINNDNFFSKLDFYFHSGN